MDAATACGIGVLLSGAGTAFFAAREASELLLRRRRLAAAISDEGGKFIAWVLRNGCKPLRGATSKLLLLPTARETAHEMTIALKERNATSSEEALASLFLLAGSAAFAIASLIAQSAIAGLAVIACLTICTASFGKSLKDKRRKALMESIPSSLRSMSVCFKAGLSLMQTMRQTGQDVGGTLGAMFERAARKLETGSSASEALEDFRQNANVPELAFVAVALVVQHQSGGGISHVLDVARESLENELELRRSLRVQTAQAQLSARIVTVMPFILIALFSAVSEGFLSPFFESWEGMGLLAIALGMQAMGILLVRRMLHIEEG